MGNSKIGNRLSLYKEGTPKLPKEWWSATAHKIRSFRKLDESVVPPKKCFRYSLRVLKLLERIGARKINVAPSLDESIVFEVGDILIEVFEKETIFYNPTTEQLKSFPNTINLDDRLWELFYDEEKVTGR